MIRQAVAEDISAIAEVCKAAPNLTIEALSVPFSVCKVRDYPPDILSLPFCFPGKTDREKSLVCPTCSVPPDTTAREDHWRAFRVEGSMDFSLIGILAGISGILARQKISIFAVSTFDTDYVLTKEEHFAKALSVLRDAGYTIRGKAE